MGEDIDCSVNSDDSVSLSVPSSFKPQFPVKADTHGFNSKIGDRALFVPGRDEDFL